MLRVEAKKHEVRGPIALMTILIMLAILLTQCETPNVAHAQNNGSSGTFTVAQVAFSNVSATGPSKIFQNIGASAHFLTFCITSGTGSAQVDLEESFDGSTNWIPLVTGTNNGNCGVLQVGGYWQNVRANILNRSFSGNPGVTAWYSATSGPISYVPPATGNGGSTSPVLCNNGTNTFNVASTATGAITSLSTFLPNSAVSICSYTISFVAATTTGTVTFRQGTGVNCATNANTLWVLNTTSGTPQTINSPPSPTALINAAPAQNICLINASGSDLTIDYTTVRQ